MTFLFLYGIDYMVIHGWTFKDALVNFYNHVGGVPRISGELFQTMLRSLNDTEAVDVFNALLPEYAVLCCYKNLEKVPLHD